MGESEFLQVFGDITISNIVTWVVAIGLVAPKVKGGLNWLRKFFKKTENNETALSNAEKLPEWHKQNIKVRDEFKQQMDSMQRDLSEIKKSLQENEALKKGVQALLRRNIIETYNKYHDKGYMPIWAREEFTEAYEAYTGLGGNGVAHGLYEKAQVWPTEPEEKKEVKNNEDE